MWRKRKSEWSEEGWCYWHCERWAEHHPPTRCEFSYSVPFFLSSGVSGRRPQIELAKPFFSCSLLSPSLSMSPFYWYFRIRQKNSLCYPGKRLKRKGEINAKDALNNRRKDISRMTDLTWTFSRWAPFLSFFFFFWLWAEENEWGDHTWSLALTHTTVS